MRKVVLHYLLCAAVSIAQVTSEGSGPCEGTSSVTELGSRSFRAESFPDDHGVNRLYQSPTFPKARWIRAQVSASALGDTGWTLVIRDEKLRPITRWRSQDFKAPGDSRWTPRIYAASLFLDLIPGKAAMPKFKVLQFISMP